MPITGLPIPPRFRELLVTLAAAGTLTAAGCSGDTRNSPAPPQPAPNQAGPVVDAGPEFPIVASRLEVHTFSMRPGETLPSEALRLIKARAESMPEPLRSALTQRGFLAAFVNTEEQLTLEHILTTKPIETALPLPRPTPKPAPTTPTLEGSGVSPIGGAQTAATPSTPPPEPIVTPTPRGSAVGDIAALTVRPSAAWEPLIDATPRTEPWALALGPAVASLKPGTLRCFVRVWPAPAEPVPTAGMAAELRIQVLPVITGPLHEPHHDPLSPPPLSNELSSRGQVLNRQAFTTALRGDSALVLVALPAAGDSAGPGPDVEVAPMLGQALLGPGPATLSGGRSTGPRVLMLKAVVPGTYRLMLDRPIAEPSEQPR